MRSPSRSAALPSLPQDLVIMPANTSTAPVPTLQEQLVREACSMARHLVTNGARVPAGLVQAADQFEQALEQKQPVNMTALAATHERLARLVAPAKPGTLHLLDVGYHQRGATVSSLGPIKLVRELVRVAMVCVAVFIVLSVVALVDASGSVDLLDIDLVGGKPATQDDHDMLIIRIVLERVFWLAAAGIGASFAMLFTLNDQITSRTFDPDEVPSFWVKFFLGLVAGFILVALVPFDTGGADGTATGAQTLGPPTIALLGGFSASAVYRILTRMVEALESVFTGGAKEQAAAAEKAASARANEEFSQGKMAVAGQLVDLQQQLAAGMPADQAAAHLKQLVGALVPTAFDVQNGPPAEDAGFTDKVPAFAVIAAPESTPVAAPQPPQAPAPRPQAAAPAPDPQPADASVAVG
jgi:hypothetical protein